MPRDWDLFAFAGVPVVVSSYYVVLKMKQRRNYARCAAVLSVALGCLVLIPRVVIQALPNIAVTRFNYYAGLDSSRNMNARTVLLEHLRQNNDSLAVLKESRLFRADYPEWTINEEALHIGETGRYDLAIPHFRRAIRHNPGFWNAYANLGWCYLRTNQVDSAMAFLEWANGMSPGGSRVNYRLGAAYLVAGDYDKAEFRLLEALRLNSDEQEAMAGLVTLYRMTGRTEEMLHYLTRLTQMEDAAPEYTAWLGDYYLHSGNYEQAAATYRQAINRGFDSSYVMGLLSEYPELQRAWR
jgi:tetratricopeptide (TPR) repeat protein